MNRCLVLFVEGDSEVEFYRRFIRVVKDRIGNHDSKTRTRIDVRNVNGFGGFKQNALRKFITEIKPKDKNCEYTIVLCRDTDVFELTSKPLIDWKQLEKQFIRHGASKVIHVCAKHSIEDWFLIDNEGILSYLRLPKTTKVSKSRNGYEELKRLYKMANKVYYKGVRGGEMIEHLDIEKIYKGVSEELQPLYDVIAKQ